MLETKSLQTLDLIINDISTEINLSMEALEAYSQTPKSKKKLNTTLGHLNKLKGIFILLELPSAHRLILDITKIVTGLDKCQKKTRKVYLEALSVALIQLARYVVHVNKKDYAIPELLIHTINELRTSVNAAHLDESYFFSCELNIARPDRALTLITSEESAAKSCHFRQLYQIGLIEVLRQTNLPGGLRMMQKAMQKLDNECVLPSSPNLWWIAEAMLEGYIQNGLVLTRPRLKLFSRLDRLIRSLTKKSYSLISDKQDSKLVAREMLYLVSISQIKNNQLNKLRSLYKLDSFKLSDTKIRAEFIEMTGPSAQDFGSMSDALLDEIQKIESAISHLSPDDFKLSESEQVIHQMIALNNLLKILQVDDQIVRLSVAIDLLEKNTKKEQSLPDKDLKILLFVLKSIKGVVNQSQLISYSGKNTEERAIISATDLKTCQLTELLVKQLIKEFGLFTKEDRNRNHLKNIESLLSKIQQGFKQLKVDKAIPIIDGCKIFLQYNLIRNPHSTSDSSIEFFADLISSLEFYLETLKYTAEPSGRILEFAENSLTQLQANLNKSELEKN